MVASSLGRGQYILQNTVISRIGASKSRSSFLEKPHLGISGTEASHAGIWLSPWSLVTSNTRMGCGEGYTLIPKPLNPKPLKP